MTAFVDVIFDFVSYALAMGKVRQDETVSKSAFLQIKDMDKIKITDIKSSSEFITVEHVPNADLLEENQLEYKVTLSPGLPIGRINEEITVRSNSEERPEAKLRLSGSIVGDVEASPEAIRFTLMDTTFTTPRQSKYAVIMNHRKELPLEVLEVSDPDNKLDLELKTMIPGEKFQVTATPTEAAMRSQSNLKGKILVKTNNPDQPEVSIDYHVYWRK